MKGIGRITGTVKHYDWGGTVFIPALLRTPNPDQKPYAELWLGAHPLADCRVEQPGKSPLLLRELITIDPQGALGESVYRKFGTLPYLLKMLDVREMLSIQVHPSKLAAEKEFALENGLNIPIDAPNRNYKDNNHKPELALALSEFWLLHGFKSETNLKETLNRVGELKSLLPVFESGHYEGLYRKVMQMPQGEVNSMLHPLLDRILPLYNEGKLSKSSEDFWAARAALTFSHDHSIDRGIFSIYFFNLLLLQKGEAIFQDAGIPHAYLEGQTVEIMSNSDNVLRGGLTTKHVDVNELLKHVRFEATDYKILTGENKSPHEIVYRTIAPDFELSCFELNNERDASFTAGTAEILLLTEGNLDLSAGKDQLELKPGKPAAIVFAGQPVEMKAKGNTTVFRATVPIHSGE